MADERTGAPDCRETGADAREKAIRGVIFDCDGVMIDSTDANRAFYNLILEHYGLAPMRPDQERYCFMATSADALRFLLPKELHGEIDVMGREVVNYRRRILPLVKIFPGFLDFVHELHNYGVKMAVLTNRTDGGLRSVLDFFSLPSYFAPLVTASCGFPKPRPEGARSILADWGCERSEVLFVGDSAVDQKTALAADIPFAAFCPSVPLEADCTADSYASLFGQILPRLPRLSRA